VIESDEPVLLRLLQISDLHFGPPYLEHVGQAVLKIAPQLNVHAVVINGDLTQRAKREQFVAAKEFLQKLPSVPQLVIPGNHDVPLYRVFERLMSPHALYKEIISAELNPVLSLCGAVIVGLDSTAPHTAISNGRISNPQLDLCEHRFQEHPAELIRIVVAHHQFVPAPDYLRDKRLQNARQAIERFVGMNVELILGGHLHRAYVGNSLDFYRGTDPSRGIIIAQCGTTTSRRGRGRETEKNSFNVIEIRRSVISVKHYMYFEHTRSFELLSDHGFNRNANLHGGHPALRPS
jgi:3',5'-cyclic AMP phosphodiesterase CpdA